MGVNSIEDLKSVCPQLERIDEPACPMAELIWIKYLAYNLVNQNKILTSNKDINSSGVTATVITKLEAERSYATRIVLRCDEQQTFEGMILSHDKEPKLLRPFCLSARYDKMPGPYDSLKKTVNKVGLSHIDGAGLEHIFSRLLLMNHLRKEIGEQFWNNLTVYAQYLESTKIVNNVWLED